MVRLTSAAILTWVAIVCAAPSPQLKPDPAGARNVGNGQGRQFITGACLSNADCASGCCAGLNGGGICSGPAVGNAQGKTGCGFGGSGGGRQAAAPASSPGAGKGGKANKGKKANKGGNKKTNNSGNKKANNGGNASAAGIDQSAPGAGNVGTGKGKQFITGQCFSDADCASGCCAGRQGSKKGACSAVLVAKADGKTGCGFVQA